MPLPSEPLRGRSAIVTGAAGGIGAATAALLNRAGASVLLVDLEPQALDSVAAEIGGNAIATWSANLTDKGAATAVVETILARFGRIDILVNNAAIQAPPGTVTTTSPDDWERYLAVNLRAPAELAAATIPWLEQNGGGSIVNIGSLSSFLVFPQQAAYAASKGAIVQLTRSIALDFGPKGIRCNCVCPGPTFAGPTLAGRTRLEAERDPTLLALQEAHALRRLAEPEDVAEAVLFLSGPGARHITGALIVVDGGFSIR